MSGRHTFVTTVLDAGVGLRDLTNRASHRAAPLQASSSTGRRGLPTASRSEEMFCAHVRVGTFGPALARNAHQ